MPFFFAEDFPTLSSAKELRFFFIFVLPMSAHFHLHFQEEVQRTCITLVLSQEDLLNLPVFGLSIQAQDQEFDNLSNQSWNKCSIFFLVDNFMAL